MIYQKQFAGNKSSHRFFRFTALPPFEGGGGGDVPPRSDICHSERKRRISFLFRGEIPHCVRNDKGGVRNDKGGYLHPFAPICEICVRSFVIQSEAKNLFPFPHEIPHCVRNDKEETFGMTKRKHSESVIRHSTER